MGYKSAEEVLGALIHAYYDHRDIEAVLSCVTEDIEWIGTEDNDCAKGKKELRKLLAADFLEYPDSFKIAIGETSVQAFGTDIIIITVCGRQEETNTSAYKLLIRGTISCVRTEEGWLAGNVHISVPSAEFEKYILKKELAENRKKEHALIECIPGGVSIYRLKKDGSVFTEYASERMAKMCGFDTVSEYYEYINPDFMMNVAQEDIPHLMDSIRESLENHTPISIMYRIHVRGKADLWQRMDANIMERELEEDDLSIWYAVHTIVNDEALKIMEEQHQLQELVDSVPTGIGIYEVIDGKVSQNYMNEAFYGMLGEGRGERQQYAGENTLNATHPEDVANIKAAVHRLLMGQQMESVIYRLKQKNGEWFWIRLVASVVERREGYIKIYGVFSDYNSIITAQQELEKNKMILKTALQSAKVLTWRYDYKTSRIIDSMTLGENYNLPKVIDHVPQAILDMGFISDESYDEFLGLFEKIKTENIVTVDTKANIRGEDGYIWFRQIYSKTFDVEGNYVDCVAIAIDITEQKMREQKYEEQLRLNQAASQNALAKLYVNLSQNSIISHESLFKEFKQHQFFETADAVLNSIKNDISDKAELKKFQSVSDCKTIIRAYKKGTSHMEIVCHLDDSIRWTQVIYDVLENPYTGDIELISSIHDVTEQIRSELVIQKLLDVEYKSILLIDNQTGIAYPFKRDGMDGNADEINKGVEHSGSQEEGLEAFFRAHALPDTVEEVIRDNSPETIKAALEENDYYECMYSLIEHGRIVQYKVTYSYLENDQRMLLSAVQDVTKLYKKEIHQKRELTRALAEADAANKAKTAFLSRVSHDMRTPLNGILGLIALLKDSVLNPKDKCDLMEMELSGNYLLNLINDTLDVSHIESGKIELHPVVCDGQTVFKNALGLARQSIEAKHIQLKVTADKIPFTKLYIDVARVEQIVMNVISNAIKFTPEGGEISVTMTNIAVEDGVIIDQIDIRDNGIGMSSEFLPHVFDAFAQEDATRTSSIKGTGLGMTITKQLLHLMGGDITAQSELGKGTCFSIILKMKIATQEQVREWEDKQISLDDSTDFFSGKCILLCEDNPLNAQIVKRMLETKGIQVEHAVNGKIGVEMFRNSELEYYDAVLMDIRMPVMDGLDAARTIRSLKRKDAGHIPIIAVTANAFAEDIQQTKDAGMDAHLSKPIQKQLFYKTLGRYLKIK